MAEGDVRRAVNSEQKSRLAEGCGVPPLRQKKVARMGHGRVFDGNGESKATAGPSTSLRFAQEDSSYDWMTAHGCGRIRMTAFVDG